MQDANEIKERIISALKLRGPSLPVHIAGEIKTSILFSSAFLGELFSEKKVRISHMKVGSSPLYFLPGQESSLENFSQHLKSKEKDAFLLLKEKRFLVDSIQSPAIRVALREIRDFALPFKKNDQIVWRYFLVPESEFKTVEEKEKPMEIEVKKLVAAEEMENEKPAEIFNLNRKKPKKRENKSSKVSKKKISEKREKFFSDVKEFLSGNSIDLLDIKSFGKKEIILKVKDKGEEKILVAYNKKKISNNDILKAHKKASALELPYMIISLSEPAKKTSELIKAMKNLSSIHSLNDKL